MKQNNLLEIVHSEEFSIYNFEKKNQTKFIVQKGQLDSIKLKINFSLINQANGSCRPPDLTDQPCMQEDCG